METIWRHTGVIAERHSDTGCDARSSELLIFSCKFEWTKACENQREFAQSGILVAVLVDQMNSTRAINNQDTAFVGSRCGREPVIPKRQPHCERHGCFPKGIRQCVYRKEIVETWPKPSERSFQQRCSIITLSYNDCIAYKRRQPLLPRQRRLKYEVAIYDSDDRLRRTLQGTKKVRNIRVLASGPCTRISVSRNKVYFRIAGGKSGNFLAIIDR